MIIRPRNRRIGILLSGRGSNSEAIATAIDRGSLDAQIGIVISNIDGAPGLKRAEERGLRSRFVPSRGQPRDEFDRTVLSLLIEHDVSLVCLAGFMRILGPDFVATFPYGILNIHPSLLPSFPGLHVQQQALDYGVRVSGCTVHFVDESLDGGPIIRQAVVTVLDEDTPESLAARILLEEHRIYPEAIDAVLSGRCEIRGRRVTERRG